VNVAKLSGNLKYIQRCKIRCDADLSGMNNTSLQNIYPNEIYSIRDQGSTNLPEI